MASVIINEEERFKQGGGTRNSIIGKKNLDSSMPGRKLILSSILSSLNNT